PFCSMSQYSGTCSTMALQPVTLLSNDSFIRTLTPPLLCRVLPPRLPPHRPGPNPQETSDDSRPPTPPMKSSDKRIANTPATKLSVIPRLQPHSSPRTPIRRRRLNSRRLRNPNVEQSVLGTQRSLEWSNSCSDIYSTI